MNFALVGEPFTSISSGGVAWHWLYIADVPLTPGRYAGLHVFVHHLLLSILWGDAATVCCPCELGQIAQLEFQSGQQLAYPNSE